MELKVGKYTFLKTHSEVGENGKECSQKWYDFENKMLLECNENCEVFYIEGEDVFMLAKGKTKEECLKQLEYYEQ